MFLRPAPLVKTAAALRSGAWDLLAYVTQACQRVEALDEQLQALLPEPDRFGRLQAEARALQQRYPDPVERPVLYGVLVGVKDIFRADGFPTRAGANAKFPDADLMGFLAGAQASTVSVLKQHGALVLGKTVTAEFAYIDPGPTRNPHHLDHTPGGSSSGSAAAVAAGYCPLALGSQTIGSIIRPAAYCGLVGFKPSFGRIATDGVVPVSHSLDHVGLLTQDVAGMALAASLLCADWQTPGPDSLTRKPVLGIPDGPYLKQASPEGLAAFEQQVRLLKGEGYRVRRVATLADIQDIAPQTIRLMGAEAAVVHAEWFARYESLYGPHISGLIRQGQMVSAAEQEATRTRQLTERTAIQAQMDEAGIDLWICPAATGPAPEGLSSTGNSAMNLAWSFLGMPAVTLPVLPIGAPSPLPLGLQCVARYQKDEQLLAWAQELSGILHILSR